MDNPAAESPQASPAGERLDSWKEIASYLKRGVRSVQRWEAEEGMPVRRHVHSKGGTVYALKSELDAWWRERGAILADRNGAHEVEPSAAEPAPSEAAPESAAPVPRRFRRAGWVAAGFAAAVLAGGVVAWLSRNGSGASAGSGAIPFQARDWILVAGFENRTGDALFDGTLEYALGRELANSRHVNVVPRERIADALRLMRKPPDTRLDAALGREVCLRDGEIRTLVTGRVEKLGSKYLLTVAIVEPKQGRAVASLTEESGGQDGSLAAVRRISDRVRQTLGETIPAGSGEGSLAKVTTSNLRALQLYTQADSLIAQDKDAAAEELLRQAVAEDPGFASAFVHLAHSIHNQGRPLEDYRPPLETAFRLSDATTERERYFIRGSYYQLLGQTEKAIAAYEALLSLYPDHPWATGNLINALDWSKPKDLDRIVELERREADASPGNFELNWNAGHSYYSYKRDPARAQPYLLRARELLAPDDVEASPWAVSWLELLPFTEHWLGADVSAAAGALDRVAARLESLAGRTKQMFAVKIALGYLTLGRIETAERIARQAFEPVIRNDTLARVASFGGDTAALRKRLEFQGQRELGRLSPGWWETTAILQARAGLTPQARAFLEAEQQTAKKSDRSRFGALETVRGEIALERGDLDAAIRELEEGIRLSPEWSRRPSFYLASESLAAALKEKGDLPRAIEVLERASEARFQAVVSNSGAGVYWLRNRFELARLYRDIGRVEDARAIEAELLKLLALADREHPILLELQRLPSS